MSKKNKKVKGKSGGFQPNYEGDQARAQQREEKVPPSQRSAKEKCEKQKGDIDVKPLQRSFEVVEKENEDLKSTIMRLREEIVTLKGLKCCKHQVSLNNCQMQIQEEGTNMDTDETPEPSKLGACSIEYQKDINISHGSKQENLSNQNEEVRDCWEGDNYNPKYPRTKSAHEEGSSEDLWHESHKYGNNEVCGSLESNCWQDSSDKANHKNKKRGNNVVYAPTYGHDWRDPKKVESHQRRVKEINGDLFTAPKEHSLAHCVAEDLKMGSGIAVQFRQVFKCVAELYGQRKKVGQVAVLTDNQRFIYYLITKKVSESKPRLFDFEKSLLNMKQHIIENQVKNLAIPRLGCGLDKLDWSVVRNMLEKMFQDVDIEITVYNFTQEPTASLSTAPRINLRIKDVQRKLVDMECNTLLILFGSDSGCVDETMLEINKKFRITSDYTKSKMPLGEVLYINKYKEVVAILIVKENQTFSFTALRDCLKKLQKYVVKEQFYYLGFEAFQDSEDDLIVNKITTLFKNAFSHTECELWICWPPNLEPGCWQYQHEHQTF